MFGSVFSEGQPMLFYDVRHNCSPAVKGGFQFCKDFPTIFTVVSVRFSCDHLFEVLLQRAHWKVHWFHLLSLPLGFPPSSPSSLPPTIPIIFLSFSWLMKLLVPPPSSWGPAKSSKNRPCYHWDCSVCSAQILTQRSALLVQFLSFQMCV